MPVLNSRGVNRVFESTVVPIQESYINRDYGFNTVGGLPGDVYNRVEQSTMIRDALYMWQKNPLANSIIELQLDYVIGDGITYEANDPEVQAVLDAYWNDSDNDWSNKQVDRYRDLSLFGELILETQVLPGTGLVKVNSIFPENVTDIIRNKRYHERAEKLVLNGDEEMDIIRYDKLRECYTGDAFFLTVNKSTFQSRGVGDLYVNRDWLRLNDKSLYANIERIGLLLSFVWDITMKGAEEPDLQAKLNSIRKNPPRPGGVRVHNEKEEWKAESPSLSATEFSDAYRLLKGQIIGGSRQPEHFFGMGDQVNRASAYIMSKPYYKKISRRQNLIKSFTAKQFDYQISKAKEYNMFSSNVTDFGFRVNMPPPNDDMATDLSDTLVKYSQSLTVLEANGLIDKDTAKTVIGMVIGQLGINETEKMNAEDTEENEESKKIVEAKRLISHRYESINKRYRRKADRAKKK